MGIRVDSGPNVFRDCYDSHARMIRLFIGIAIPSAVNARLEEFINRLKPLARIRWSPASNFHITTKFIGAWPEDRLDELKQALAKLSSPGGFAISVGGIGFYPNARSPHVFWAGIDGGEPLRTLASRTDEVCAKLGVESEKRAYSPHLTLARMDNPKGLGALHDAIAKNPSPDFGAFEATAFHLYRSRPGPGGSVYTSLAEFRL